MRCLHCGKELAFLKRFTGGGEFCSDAHRQSYQEEYNRLALSRLMQAQTKSEETKTRAAKQEAAKTKAPAKPSAAELVATAMAHFCPQIPAIRSPHFEKDAVPVPPLHSESGPLFPPANQSLADVDPPVVQDPPLAGHVVETYGKTVIASGKVEKSGSIAEAQDLTPAAPVIGMAASGEKPRTLQPIGPVPLRLASLRVKSCLLLETARDFVSEVRFSQSIWVDWKVAGIEFPAHDGPVNIPAIASRLISDSAHSGDAPLVLEELEPADPTQASEPSEGLSGWADRFDDPAPSTSNGSGRSSSNRPRISPGIESNGRSGSAIGVVESHGNTAVALAEPDATQQEDHWEASAQTHSGMQLMPMVVKVITPARGRPSSEYQCLAVEAPVELPRPDALPLRPRMSIGQADPVPSVRAGEAKETAAPSRPDQSNDWDAPRYSVLANGSLEPAPLWQQILGHMPFGKPGRGVSSSTKLTGLGLNEPSWISNWGQDSKVLPGRSFSIYAPSLRWSDYRITFEGQIEQHGIGWVFRATDASNYYAMKLVETFSGYLLKKYRVVEGVEHEEAAAPIPPPLAGWFQVQLDVVESRFTTLLQGREVDSWTDHRLKTGGAGLLNDPGDRADIRNVGISLLPATR